MLICFYPKSSDHLLSRRSRGRCRAQAEEATRQYTYFRFVETTGHEFPLLVLRSARGPRRLLAARGRNVHGRNVHRDDHLLLHPAATADQRVFASIAFGLRGDLLL